MFFFSLSAIKLEDTLSSRNKKKKNIFFYEKMLT